MILSGYSEHRQTGSVKFTGIDSRSRLSQLAALPAGSSLRSLQAGWKNHQALVMAENIKFVRICVGRLEIN